MTYTYIPKIEEERLLENNLEIAVERKTNLYTLRGT